MDVSAGVCPVFGCVKLGLDGGHIYFDAGPGLAISLPGFSVTAASKNRARGCTESDPLFGELTFLAGSLSGSVDLKSEEGEWSAAFVNLQEFDPEEGKGGFGFGGGYYHSWRCEA